MASHVWDLPRFSRGDSGVMNKLLNGWQFSGVFQYQTGDRLTILSGRENSLTGIGLDRGILTGADSSRPDSADKTSFLNKDALAVNPIGTFGTAGKGRFHGPNLINFDTGLFKNTPINEKINTQFRAEFFNVFNRTNFNDPGPTVRSGNFGRILSARDPRIIQLGFKVTF